MAIGGYTIVDLKGIAMNTGARKNIPGIHDRVERSAGRKPLLVTNFVKDGIEQTPVFGKVFTAAGAQAGSLQLSVSQYGGQTGTFTIDADDTVSFRQFGVIGG